MRIINLEQGSQEWLEYRKNHIGASDVPFIMGDSIYKKSPLMLWKEKVGLSQPQQQTPAMARGHALEEPARQRFIEQTNVHISPAVAEHDTKSFMSASYDGLSSDHKVAVEIKCVKKELHEMALAGEIPKTYYGQLQHQWYIGTGEIEELFYASYLPGHDKEFIVLPVKRDDAYIKSMLRAEMKFADCLINLIPPDATDLDYSQRCDDEWCTTATSVMRYAEQAKYYKEMYEQEKAKLIELSAGTNTLGGGVKLTKYVTKGRVRYDKIPNLLGVNLDEYRTEPTESYRITPIQNSSISNGSF